MEDYSPYDIQKRREKHELKAKPTDLATWDPMKEDFEDNLFNKYTKGPGRDLPDGNEVKREGGDKIYTLFVTGIPIEVSEDGLKNMFLAYGTVRRVKKMRPKNPESADTFGFVDFVNVKQATDAITGLDRKKFKNGSIVMRVKFALTEAQKEERKRREEYHAKLMQGVGEKELAKSGSESEEMMDRRVVVASSERAISDSFGRSHEEEPDESKTETRSNGLSSGYNSDIAASPRLGSKPPTPEASTTPPSSCAMTSTVQSLISLKSPTPSASLASNAPTKADTNTVSSQAVSTKAPSLPVRHPNPTPFQDGYRLAGGAGRGGRGRGMPYGAGGGGMMPRFPQGPGPYQHPRPPSGYMYPNQPYPGYGANSGFNSNYFGAPFQYDNFGTWTPSFGNCPIGSEYPPYAGPGYGGGPSQGLLGHCPPGYLPYSPPADMQHPGYNARHHSNTQIGLCAVCHKKGENWCSKCHCVFYCSVTCQRADWKRHKPECEAPPPLEGASIKDAGKKKIECDFFRGTGCNAGDSCRFAHIQENAGIDKSKYEALGWRDEFMERTRSVGECFYWRTVGCREMTSCRYTHKPESKGVDFEQYQEFLKERRQNSEVDTQAAGDAPMQTVPLSKPTAKEDKATPASKSSASTYDQPKTKTSGEAKHSTDVCEQPKAKPSSINRRPQPEESEVVSQEDELEELLRQAFGDNAVPKRSPQPPKEEKSPLTVKSRSNQSVSDQRGRRKSGGSSSDDGKGGRKSSGRGSNSDQSASGKSRAAAQRKSPVPKIPGMKAAEKPNQAAASLDLEDIEAGTTVQISEASGANDFWLVKEANVSQIEELVSNLTQMCNQSDNYYTPSLNELVAAKFAADGQFYRAFVLKNNENTFKVHFVDYGNLTDVTAEDIRMLPEKYRILPVQAVQCELGLSPVSALGEWSQEAQAVIAENLTPFNKTFLLVAISGEGGKKLVRIMDKESNQDITDVLTSQKFATLQRKPDSPPKSKPQKPQNPAKTQTTKAKDKGMASQGRIPDPPPLAEYPLPSLAKNKLFPGDEVEVKVVEVVSPAQFWVNVRCKEYQEHLPALQKQLQDHYNRKQPKQSFKPNGKSLYAAKSQFDGNWYRALGYDETFEGVSVMFLDTGRRECVPFTHIHNLESSFCSLPFQAVCCAVAGIESPDGGDIYGIELCQKYHSFIMDRLFKAKVVDKDNIRIYVDLLTSEGLSLRDHMLKNGVGKACSKDLGSRTHGQSETSGFTSPPTAQRLADSGIRSQAQQLSPEPPSHITTTAITTSKAKLPEGTSRAIGVYVKGAHEFYVHRCDKQHALEFQQFITDINTWYDGSNGIYLPKIGETVSVYFEQDGEWFRCHVLKVLGDTIIAKFCDFGNVDEIPIKHVRKLKSCFLDKPWQAVKCSLYGLTEDTSQWSGRAIQEFERLINGKLILLDVANTQNDTAIVERILIEETQQDAVEVLIENRLLREEYSGRKMLKTTSVAPNLVTLQEHESRQLPEDADVLCSWVTENLELFCQIPSDAELMLAMTEAVQEHCMHNPADPSFRPRKGELCAALFSEDGSWNRACITDVISTDKLQVFFIDFGNSATVSIKDIRPYDPSWKQFPVLAAKCRLHGITDKQDAPEMVVQELRALAQDKLLNCTVLSRTEDHSVVRLYSTGEQQTDLGQAIANIMPPSQPVSASASQSKEDEIARLKALVAQLEADRMKNP